MAWIALRRGATPEDPYKGRSWFIVEKIRVRQDFLYFFDLCLGSTSFEQEYGDDGTVSELIDWIEPLSKSRINEWSKGCVDTAASKVLPTLRRFVNTDCRVIFIEESR